MSPKQVTYFMPLEERYRTVWLNKAGWETAKIYSIRHNVPMVRIIGDALHQYVICKEEHHEENIRELSDLVARMRYILKKYIEKHGEIDV